MRTVLLGGGGHASDVLGAIEEFNKTCEASNNKRIDVAGIIDDSDIDDKRFASRNISQIGNFSDLGRVDAQYFVACIGYPKGRMAVTEKAETAGLETLPAIIHPRAFLGTGVVVGNGSVVLAGSCISPLAVIGTHVYISHGCLVGHDSQVHDFSSIMPGASVSGDTILKNGVMIGANATVLQGVTIGEWATIGAGAVAVKDIPDNVVAKGIPAKY